MYIIEISYLRRGKVANRELIGPFALYSDAENFIKDMNMDTAQASAKIKPVMTAEHFLSI